MSRTAVEITAEGLKVLTEVLNETVDAEVYDIIVDAADAIDSRFGELTEEEAMEISGSLGSLSGMLMGIVDSRKTRARLN